MKKTLRILAAAMFGAAATFSTLAHADGEEDNKLISLIRVNSDGGYIIALQSPSSTLTSNCFLGLIGVHATDTAAKQWLSELLAARTSQSQISVAYTTSGGCYITWLQINQ